MSSNKRLKKKIVARISQLAGNAAAKNSISAEAKEIYANATGKKPDRLRARVAHTYVRAWLEATHGRGEDGDKGVTKHFARCEKLLARSQRLAELVKAGKKKKAKRLRARLRSAAKKLSGEQAKVMKPPADAGSNDLIIPGRANFGK
jgi:hypothetical protein